MKSAWEEAPQLNPPCLTEFQTWYIFVPDRGVFVAMTLVTTAATQLDRDAWFLYLSLNENCVQWFFVLDKHKHTSLARHSPKEIESAIVCSEFLHC